MDGVGMEGVSFYFAWLYNSLAYNSYELYIDKLSDLVEGVMLWPIRLL